CSWRTKTRPGPMVPQQIHRVPMTPLSRRSFLIGSAAAVAASLPITQAATKLLVPVQTITGTHYRRVYDLMFGSLQAADGTSRFTISRNGGTLLTFDMNWRACLRWVAAPGHELIFPPEYPMEYLVEP